METQSVTQSVTLRPLVGPPVRHANVACKGGKTTAALYDSGRLVAVLSHSSKHWIFLQVESWLGGDGLREAKAG